MNDQTQESRIRLVLLDDHGLFRASLGRLLSSESGLAVASECSTPAEALEALKSSAVDMVLMDFDIGTEHGIDFMDTARQAGYRGRFLIVAGSANVRSSAMALKLGASGIFLKSDTPDHLVQAIRIVEDGGTWVDRGILQLLAEQSIDGHPVLEDQKPGASLEERERNVLQGIVEGLTNRKIGECIGVSESCVKNVVQRLFGKAGVNTRSQLVRFALQGSPGASPEFVKRQSNDTLNDAPLDAYGPPRLASSSLPAARQSH